jgi:flagellar biosynthesis GTPase FlhF
MTGVKTYRGASLEEVLPKIKAELGPDAIVLCEREGVVGGIGGFFARRCVEVEAAPGAVLAEPVAIPAGIVPVVPARVATGAYVGSWLDLAPTDSEAETEESVSEEPPPEELLRELSFADLLAEADAFDVEPEADVELAPVAVAPEPRPAPVDFREDFFAEPAFDESLDDEADVRTALRHQGFPETDSNELVRDALLHARPFHPLASLRAVVRAALVDKLQTRLGWTERRRVIVLAGTEGADTAKAAAALCAAYARAGLAVAALGLDGVRSAVALATETEDATVAVGIAVDGEDVRRALPRLGRPDLLVAIAPTLVPGDDARRARMAELLAELPAHDLHLVLPSGATAADAAAAHAALAGAGRVTGLLPVALDEAVTIGGVVSLALREQLELRWTASGSANVSLATAAAAELAAKALP